MTVMTPIDVAEDSAPPSVISQLPASSLTEYDRPIFSYGECSGDTSTSDDIDKEMRINM